MKKSEIYQLAQVAVLTTNCITPENKLRILRELFDREDIALYCEEKEAEEEE